MTIKKTSFEYLLHLTLVEFVTRGDFALYLFMIMALEKRNLD